MEASLAPIGRQLKIVLLEAENALAKAQFGQRFVEGNPAKDALMGLETDLIEAIGILKNQIQNIEDEMMGRE